MYYCGLLIPTIKPPSRTMIMEVYMTGEAHHKSLNDLKGWPLYFEDMDRLSENLNV